jgi:D-alanyl-D-alanine carboxypeptidase/D-alanyl-D-alanine-endopeptidase (penicillin-binding protein 4)
VSGFSRTRGAWLLGATLSAACHVSPSPLPPPSSPAVRPKADGTHAAGILAALQHDIDAILRQPGLEHGYWGVLVRSLRTGDTLYALNSRKLMMPASNMKIVTLAAAAERLGWDYTYRTQLFVAGEIASGVLRGDLIVVGSGDPSVTDKEADELFGGWADRLKARGVGAIDGRIIGDDNAFEDNALGFGWSWDDLPDDYAAGVSALQFNENAVRITVSPGPSAGDWAGVSLAPPGSGLTVAGSVTTAAAGAPPSIAARRLPGSMQLKLSGSISAGSAPATLTVSVENPTLFFVNALRQALIAHGIDVRGPAVDIDDVQEVLRRPQAPLAVHESPPLSTLAVRLMKASQNLYAETLLKTLAPAAPRDSERGRAEAAATVQAWGIGPDGLIQRDGSGLSRYDYVTADALVTILGHVDRDERLRGPFEAALPIAGRDGTLAGRMQGTAAEGNARAKTGSMANVRGLSGYVTSADGEPLVFSILANNFDVAPDTIMKAADAIVVRLASHRR